MLYDAAPDLVLRPYRTRGKLSTWLQDPSVIAHLESRLARFRYVAIGEYAARLIYTVAVWRQSKT